MASKPEVIRSEVLPRLHAVLDLLGRLDNDSDPVIHSARVLVRRSVEFLEEAE